jgi:glycosyltransferase involved in cell wall biosynthesis
MKIKYVGPCRDYSGYGEACRHDIGALASAGVEITTQIPVYVPELSDYGELGDLAVSFENRQLGYNIKILHVTPNVYGMFYEPKKYLIGRAFWETNKVPLDFALNLQKMHEIWTGSEYNKQAMINAGVTKPIYIIPEAIDAKITPEEIDPYIVDYKNNYKFYSIFEWTERKNPMALLEAYWREFEGAENVSLTLKTYQISFGPEKRQGIDQQIRKLKARLNLKNFAPLFLYRQLMDKRQVYRFHRSFDCFVSAHRGEGWGIPQMEAMLMEKPIISTNLGGIHEYLTHEKDAMLIDYKMVPVDNMGYNADWYTPDQKWGQVDIDKMRESMRFMYENPQKGRDMGKQGRTIVKDKFDLPVVGGTMSKRLKDINDTLLSGII